MGLSEGKVPTSELAAIFRHVILPLLEEYFFEDWQKIRLVLNDQQKPKDTHQFVVMADDDEDLFGPEYAPAEPGWSLNPDALTRMEAFVQIIDAAATCTEEPEADEVTEEMEADDSATSPDKTSSQSFTPPESLAEAMRCKISQVKEYKNNVFIKFSSGNYAVYSRNSATKITNQIQLCRTLVASDSLFHSVTLPEDYNTYQCIRDVMAALQNRQQ